MPNLDHWNEVARKLVGRQIVRCEYAPDREFEYLLQVELDDGTVLAPMRDDEGNGPGALHALTSPDPEFFGLPVLR